MSGPTERDLRLAIEAIHYPREHGGQPPIQVAEHRVAAAIAAAREEGRQEGRAPFRFTILLPGSYEISEKDGKRTIRMMAGTETGTHGGGLQNEKTVDEPEKISISGELKWHPLF